MFDEDDEFFTKYRERNAGLQELPAPPPGPLKANAKTTEARYKQRIQMWETRCKEAGVSFPMARGIFHWVLHNTLIHILIGLFPCHLTFRLHDWSSDALNCVKYHPSNLEK